VLRLNVKNGGIFLKLLVLHFSCGVVGAEPHRLYTVLEPTVSLSLRLLYVVVVRAPLLVATSTARTTEDATAHAAACRSKATRGVTWPQTPVSTWAIADCPDSPGTRD